MDKVVDYVVERRVAPFVVGMVADRHGILWEHASGRANNSRMAGPETVFSWFSMTKAIGSLMAIMAIDRGLVTLDTPVGDVLPYFDKLQVLETVTPDGPQYRKPRRRATLRHLLTHTSGMGYEAFYPLMAEYAKVTGAPSDITGTLESLNYPLLFEPGEGFAYGVSTDWVGALVSELDGRPIDRFVHEEIIEPLGMKSTYFERAEAGDRMAELVFKRPDGSFAPFENYPAANPEIYHMGHALYGSASDYIAFLRLVLGGGTYDGQRIVGPDAMRLLFENQLGGVLLPTPVLKSYIPDMSYDIEPCPGIPKTHTAGFFRTEAEAPGMRRAGSLTWAGVLNTHYWIDPTSGIAAVFMTQMMPFCDPDFMACYEDFERAVYEEFGR
ncbi:serine hydrolase domain-containing protein [Sinomonas terrae]|uniref:Beta-lactamase family protein n=1 Tax=Sinomonas terrae TaxID=2908838 RepID=A0ABS9U272_9MICC|nr:serine hydrolase domain-containing protein [Sinomonas terrae]MCH6470750.1 beta-lactamase family protein [Sinomonas terrae]